MHKAKKNILIIVSIVLVIAIIFSCIFIIKSCNENKPNKKAQKIVAEMSIDEKIGQVLTMAFREWDDGNETKKVISLNDKLRSAIATYHLGGVALFLENCENAEQLVKLTYDMQQSAINGNNLPLLISMDQEGGNVTRAKFGTAFSGNMAIAASGDKNNAYTVGKIIGKELDALGVNCVFGPVVDVNKNEKNPIIAVRSFSGNADVASEMGTAMAKGFNDSGVLNCLKHYPGHGDTATDSHTGLPIVEESYEDWIKSDGAPFKNIVESENADLVMTAHIQYPQIDNTKIHATKTGKEIVVPATMSKKILTDILKKEFGFNGVVITDAMTMGAITEQFEPNDAVIKALNAGADIILMPFTIKCENDIQLLDKLFDDIKSAINDGRLSEQRLNDAVTRVITLKLKKGIIDKDYKFNVKNACSNAVKIVGCKEHRDIEREIASKCIDIKYDGEFKTFTPTDTDKIVCVMPRSGETYSAEHAVLRMKQEGVIPNSITECYNYESAWSGGAELDNELINAVKSADYLILGYFQTVETLGHPEIIRNVVFDKILSYATTDKIAIIWEYLPYETENYSKNYPCVVIYNSVGMTKEDVGKELYSGVYGPAIPAGMGKLFKKQ